MDIKLSDNVLINCPERGFALRKAANCFSCQFYGGIVRATQNGDDIPIDDVNFLQVVCGRPITRKLIKIAEG